MSMHDETKAGARHSASDTRYIQAAHDALCQAGAVCMGMEPDADETMPAKATETAQDARNDSEPTKDAGDAIYISFGGEIKALGNGKIGGYGVTFGGKDLTGEYFTAKTYLGPQDGAGQDTYFHHAQPIKGMEDMADYTFGPASVERRDMGIWVETVLDMANEYEKMVYALAEQGKLGWSSGAPGHLVRKSADGQIDRWPVAEWSLTPAPAEYRNRVGTLKTLPTLITDTKSDDELETEPEAARSAAAPSKAIESLVSVYTTFNAHDVKARLARVRRQP